MAQTKYAKRIKIKFDEYLNEVGNKVGEDLSWVTHTGKYQWLAFDEGAGVDG